VAFHDWFVNCKYRNATEDVPYNFPDERNNPMFRNKKNETSMKMNHALLLLLVVLCAWCSFPLSVSAEWRGKKSTWRGFDRYDFTVGQRGCYVVAPKEPAKGNPWIWRARFPDYHAEIDVELVKRGFHIAHINTAGLFGSAAALDDWDKFYELLTTKHGMSKKPALFGVSRGGLFVYRWAARHPDRVACIYTDTPVCDFKSWPGGQGKGIGSKGDWEALLKAYGIAEEEANAWRENPIDVLEPIAKAKIPLMNIVSENDRVVPPAENTDVLAKRYEALGGKIIVTRVKEGTTQSSGHHFDMTAEHIDKAVKFISQHAGEQ
jgi:sialidase-1